MPRRKAHMTSRPVTRKLDTPLRDDDGSLLPCWRCGRNTGELVGRLTTALVLDNRLQSEGGKWYWTIQHEIGEDGDPKPALREVVLNRQNYHRECDNAYTRALRASKHKKIGSLESAVTELKHEVSELKQLLRRSATPTYTPPQQIISRGPRPPGRPPAQPYDPIYSRLQPLPRTDPYIQARLEAQAESPLNVKELFANLERMELEGKKPTQAQADAMNDTLLAEALREQQVRDEQRRQEFTARTSPSEAEEDSAPPDDPEDDYR
jgi:hypothetical protein